jgi:hypothetical protein
MLRTASMAIVPYRLGRQLDVYAKAPEEQKAQMKAQLSETIEGTFESLYLPIEKDALTAQLNLYASKSGYPTAKIVDSLSKINKNNFESYVNNAFNLSLFASKERLMSFLEMPNAALIANDPLYELSSGLVTKYNEMPEDVNYINVSINNSNQWVPAVSTISVTVAPVYSREKLRSFSLQDFANGGALSKGIM